MADIEGTPGDEIIIGTTGDDTITGGSGDDIIAGNFGNDTIYGDADPLTLFGGFSEASILGTLSPAGGSLNAVGQTFTLPAGGDVIFSIDDNDPVLSGDHIVDETSDDPDQSASATLDNGDGTYTHITSADVFYYEAVMVLEDSFGNTYMMVEIEAQNADDLSPGDGDGLFTFVGNQPPPGAELTVVNHVADFDLVDSADALAAGVDTSGGDPLYSQFTPVPPGSMPSNNDTIDGGYGHDTIYGQDGDDLILGSLGGDVIDGGDGRDTYSVHADDGPTTLSEKTITVTIDSNTTVGSVSKSGDMFDNTLTSVETIIADEDQTSSSGTDWISFTDAINFTDISTKISGLDDNAVGTYVRDGNTINFGPSEALQLCGDESGTIGKISFENFEKISFNVVCYATGTMIRTETGETPVENLVEGDMIWTLDNGYRPLRWVGSQTVKTSRKNSPIRIEANALGAGYPMRPLMVSPQHRLLVRSKVAVRMFDSEEVLVAAKHLLGLSGVTKAGDLNEVTYVHFMFDQHEIVCADGALSESFLPGPEALKTLDHWAAKEVHEVFPELSAPDYVAVPARPIAKKAHRVTSMVERLKQNTKPLFSTAPMRSAQTI